MPKPQGLTRGGLLRGSALAATTAYGMSALGPGTEAAHADPVGFGASVLDFGATRDGATDDSAAFQAAHDAVVGTGGVVFVPRGTYALATPLKFARGNSSWVRLLGEGMGATVIKASGGNGQLAQFDKVDDYDIFRYIEIADLTFDCDNVAVGRGHAVLGILPWHTTDSWPVYQTRLHLHHIAVRRVRVVNAPADPTRISGVHLSAAVETGDDTDQLNVTDICIEDVRVDGAATGFAVIGTASDGPLRDGNVKVFLDRIEISRCYHDTGVVPTGKDIQGNIHVGGVGFGGSVRVRDCYGANSADIGLEIDGMTDAVVEGCTMVDAWKNNFLTANFRRPESLAAQRYVYIGCTARNINLDPTSAEPQPHHWGLQGDPSTPHFIFGELTLIGCQSRVDAPLANFSMRGNVIHAANARYRALTIRDLSVGMEQLHIANANPGYPSLVDIVPLNPAVVKVDGIHFRLQGTREGTGKVQLRFVRLGGRVLAEVANVAVEMLVSGMSKNTDAHKIVDIGDVAGSVVRASLRGVRVVGYDSNADVRGIVVNSTGTLTVPADCTIVAKGCSFDAAPGSSPDYDVHSSQLGRFFACEIAGQRTTGSAAPPTKPTPVNPGASPYTYVNTDTIVEDVFVSGTTVTGLEFSDDNSTFYDTRMTAGVFRLAPGQAIRVTYVDAPSMIKVPAR